MSLFDSFAQASTPQMSQQDMTQKMQQVRQNPIGMLESAGYKVPHNLANNPQAIVQHLMQTGQIRTPALQRIQPMLNMLMGRR